VYVGFKGIITGINLISYLTFLWYNYLTII